jgi:fatty-acyl-CoA synthase
VGADATALFEPLTYVDIERRSARLAQGLSRLGFCPGESVAVWLPNRPSWMLVHLAAARLGLLTVPVNTWCRESEVSHLLALGNCRAIVLDSAFRGIDFTGILNASIDAMRGQGNDSLRWVIDAAAEPSSAPAHGSLQRLRLSDLEATEDFGQQRWTGENASMIAFSTSGTTSAPKLAVHRDTALLAHAQAVAGNARMTSADTVLAVLPPCGAYGYGLLMAALSVGARAILCEEFEMDRALELIESEQVTMLAVTEPLIRRLLDHPRASPQTLRSLRLVFSAGGTLQAVVERAEAQFGFRVSNVYGSSELLALAAFWDFDVDCQGRSAAGGRLTSGGMRVRAIDTAGQPLPRGREGELQFSGPVLTTGYLKDEKATRSAFSEDGWFSSQDLGQITNDEGTEFLYIARLNDAIRLKGFLVSPGEIEAMLQSHPMVKVAQVVGIPEEAGEEIAAAFVILNDNCGVEAQALRDYCRNKMASYKVPALLEIVTAFPMTRSANGDKVMKNKLREIAKGIKRS